MDSLTHLALGACMGEAFAGKKLGKKAMLWGALGQSVPDIDFVASFWMDTSSNLLAHRGFTHSFLFCVLVTPVMAHLAEKWHRPHNIGFQKWCVFFGSVIGVHVLIDAFNNYGVGWFEPFNHLRVSFNAIYVADPLFSIWPGLACLGMLYFRKNAAWRARSWKWGLGLSALYLLYCLGNKATIDSRVKAELKRQDISYVRYFTTPAPLQNWLWFIVAGNDDGYHVAFHSLFDSKREIDFEYFPRNDHLLAEFNDEEELHKLVRFSQEFYTVEEWNDTLVFNDLRFGQIVGWHNSRARFVFHYFLRDPTGNDLVVQRGRFEGWNYDTFISLLKRIKGNEP